jgi:hypothetical protein
MRTPWLAALGAVFPSIFTPAWRSPVDDLAAPASLEPSEARAILDPAQPAAHAGHRRNGRLADPEYLTVVPYLPTDDPAHHRRVHPRILNPFRAFPRRSADLRELMDASPSSD